MKSPEFWNRRNAFTALLSPLSIIYKNIVQARVRKKPLYTSHLPVICVGNAVMGGSGKTPVVQALAELLQEMGRSPAVLLRGYGGSVKGPIWVEKGSLAALVGDEALLHASLVPTLVSANRVKGAQKIEKNPAIKSIVMDDGLQNPSLKKTASFLVVDGANPMGNGLIFPGGPLRETVEDAIKRVQAMIILGDDIDHLSLRYGFACPIFYARLRPVNSADFSGKPVIAFAGIGRPQKFFDTLRQADAILADTHTFPDHYAYSDKDIHALIEQANKIGGLLVTTRKDWVRLPATVRPLIQVLDVALEWQDRAAVKNLLECLV